MSKEPSKGWADRIDKRIENHRVVKETVQAKVSELNQYRPSKAVRQAKTYKRQTRHEVNLAKKEVKLATRNNDEPKLTISKERLEKAKLNKKAGKKVLASAYKRKGGSPLRKTVRKGYQVVRRMGEDIVKENDQFGEIIDARRNIRHAHATKSRIVKVGRLGKNITKGLGKGLYSLSNRGFNLVRGRGFTRTPFANRWETQVAKRIHAIRVRIARNKLVKSTKMTGRILNFLTKPLQVFLKNPLSLGGLFNLSLIVVIMVLFGSSTTLRQNEFELTRTWIAISKLDRKYSTEEIDYWSDIDSILEYTNYVYGAFKLGDTWEDPADVLKRRQAEATPGGNPDQYNKTYQDLISELWKDLNGDKEKLQTMKDLYGKDSKFPDWKLTEKKLKEYEELLDLSEEAGAYRHYKDLENPFYVPGDPAYGNPLVISKRFGHTSTDSLYEGSVFQISQGHKLFAVMDGKVELIQKDGKTDLVLKSKKAEFTYKDVGGARFKDGDQIKQGDEIGTVNSATGLSVYYKKLEDDKKGTKDDVWTHVNPGFYFTKVDYTQQTYLIESSEVEGGIGKRIQQAYNAIKKHEPKATVNGVSSMLGNFWTESEIDPKTAEGDFLDPPIGAYEGAWDDPNWLSLGGPSIYNGSMTNIIHRGIGYGQWSDTTDGSNRHTLLLNYAKEKGKKWYDMELQIDFIFNGDVPYYRQIAREIVTSNESVDISTPRFATRWEGNRGDKTVERVNNAKAVLDYLNSAGRNSGTAAASYSIPPGYDGKFNPPSTTAMTTQKGGATYPVGQCTWYVYNRLVETGQVTDFSGTYSYLGNGQDWVRSLGLKGWKTSSTPSVGAVVSTKGGFDSTFPSYGHVGYVEYVNPDGSFLVSECNYNGVQDKVHYRVCRPASFYTFATNK